MVAGKKALIIVDMQEGFLEEGNPLFCGARARRVIRPIAQLIEETLDKDLDVFFTTDIHQPGDKEFEIFPPHCLEGSKQARVVPELQQFVGRVTVVKKRRFSAFFDTDLDEHLHVLNIEHLTICGVCTDICVLHTVADARNRDYAVEVPRDCVASLNEHAHNYALEHMRSILGASITSRLDDE